MQENTTSFRTEGSPAFPVEPNTGDGNSPGSSPEQTKTETTPSTEGDKNTQPSKEPNVPFDKHPAWHEREEKWNKKFNEQETRHQEDLRQLREEFGGKREANAQNTEIPEWFGGDQKQWDAFRAHEDKRITDAEERAYARLEKAKEQEAQKQKEATDYMQSEMAAIETDTELNPAGSKIDANKLLDFVLKNYERYNLVDMQGRWNWRAAWLILQQREASKAPAPTPSTMGRKDIAAATTSEAKAETTPTAYKTNADFKKSRPW